MDEPENTGKLSYTGEATITSNIDVHIIQITEDKLKLCLLAYSNALKDADAWQLPFSLAFTFLITLITTRPVDAFSLSAGTWQSFFLIAFGISIIWLIKLLRNNQQKMTLDELIAHIKEKT